MKVKKMYKTPRSPPPSPSLRLYQVWKGKNKFFLGGRLMFGPDVGSLFLTVPLIVTPVVLFCTFISQGLIEQFPHYIGNLIVSLSIVFTLHIIILLFITSGSDPGIIPRNHHPPEEVGDSSSSSIINWCSSRSASRILPPKDVTVNGMTVTVKYCQTCLLYRPPRCSHCSICNNCVERFDHHCPWVGQCIGKRNYRYFFMFVSSTTILSIYVFTFCWVNINSIMGDYHCNLWKALKKSPVSGILIVYTFIGAWFVGGLTVFHLYLICTNQTTYENFRYQYDKKTNPYNLGINRNIGEIFLSRIPDSKNEFRAKVKGSNSLVYSPSVSLGRFDIETGKRKGGVVEDYEDIHSQNESVAGSDRSESEPKHTNWESTPDFEMSHFGQTNEEKISAIV